MKQAERMSYIKFCRRQKIHFADATCVETS